jgi:GAF domain-containing protein
MGNDELNRQLENPFLDQERNLDPGLDTREQLLGRLIVGQTLAVALLAAMTSVGGLLIPGSGLLAMVPLGAIGAAVGLVAYGLLRRHRVQLASYVFLIGTSVAITSVVYVRGYQDASGIYYLWPILGAATLLGARGGLLVAVVSGVFYLIFVILQELGYQVPLLPYSPEGEALLTVGSRLLMFFLLAFLGWLLSRNLGRALQQATQAASRWRELGETLERRVADRTRDLERRTRYLELTAQVAQEAASVLELEALLDLAVTSISERFEVYRMGIFLIDPTGEWVMLRAASGEGGQRLLADGFRIKVKGEGIVAHVIRSGVPYVASDVREDPMYLDVPDVADTRSEMTLPLRARGEIIGAMAVQSTELYAFGDEDLAVMQTLAGQVAMAISNARLFRQAQESLEAERRAYGELSRGAWRELLGTQPDLSIIRDERGISTAGDLRQPEVEEALRTGQAITAEDGGQNLAMPIKVRGQVIGAIDAYKPDESGNWTTEQIALLEVLAEQLGDALEDARSYEDAQRRAAQDRLLAEATAHMRETLDMDTVLRTAVQEMRQALGLSSMTIRLATPADGPSVDGGGTR